ncbi:hypothetical protein HY972_00155 [Candidatus Kaiserbacteria bacterium]|nr:hypothetical protein [Candidatus Kaiserbacteria bacterium]
MNQTRLWAAAAIIATLVIAGFVLSVPHTRDVPKTPAPPSAFAGAPSVTIRDAFKRGMHTLTGSIIAPDACSIVSARASRGDNASSTRDILVEVSLSEDTGVCLELPTRMTFETTLAAPANLPIAVTINGAAASTSAP